MKPPLLRVAVVGCGTAGPAAATLLARQGHAVTLFERAPACKPVGAGFLLQPSGMSVLGELGILQPVLAKAARVERLHVLDERGRPLMDLRYRDLGEPFFGAGLHRPVLLHHLIAAMKEAGVGLRWDSETTGAVRREGKWRLTLADGSCEDGFDLLIVADGARSKLRDQLGAGGVNRGYAWGAHWFIGKNNDAFPENELYQVVNGTRQLGGFLATGRELDGEEPLVSLFWSLKLSEDEAWRSRPLADWKHQILNLCPRAENLLGQISSWDQVLTARYGDVRMRRWFGEGLVFLGDAAHAMSPQLGQGVNLALADASCLAHAVSRLPLDRALRQYQRDRRFALGYYALATRWLTPWFQSDHEWLSPVRRAVFRAMQPIRPARRLMTLSMAGLIGAWKPKGAGDRP